jgi:hypothetical protein
MRTLPCILVTRMSGPQVSSLFIFLVLRRVPSAWPDAASGTYSPSVAEHPTARFNCYCPFSHTAAMLDIRIELSGVAATSNTQQLTAFSDIHSTLFHSFVLFISLAPFITSPFYSILAYFPYFEKIKIGLCDLCICENPHPINF